MDPFAALNKACVRSFGVAVSYQQDTATPFPVLGIVMKDSDEERLIDGLYARLFVDAADFTTSPNRGDVATIAGVPYTVFDLLTDATGGVTLSLRAVA